MARLCDAIDLRMRHCCKDAASCNCSMALSCVTHASAVRFMLGSSCGSASKMACSSVCVMVRCSRPHSLTNMCSCWPMTRIESAAHDSLISLSNDDCCSARTNAAHKGARSSTGVARSGMAMAVTVDAAAAGGSREPAVGTGGGSVSRKMAATYACSASSTSTRHCSRVSVSAATLFVRSASPPTLYPTPRALLQQPQVSERTEPNERSSVRTLSHAQAAPFVPCCRPGRRRARPARWSACRCHRSPCHRVTVAERARTNAMLLALQRDHVANAIGSCPSNDRRRSVTLERLLDARATASESEEDNKQ